MELATCTGSEYSLVGEEQLNFSHPKLDRDGRPSTSMDLLTSEHCRKEASEYVMTPGMRMVVVLLLFLPVCLVLPEPTV